jgi:hypothetical protein
MIIDRGDLLMAGRNGKNGRNGKPLQRAPEPPKVSRLGQLLREISDKALASGTRVLSADEIHDRLAEIRGGR